MSLEIPEKIPAEEWKKLPESQRPIFRQSNDDPGMYEYAVPQFHNSMVNAKTERDEFKSQLESYKAELNTYKKFGEPDKLADLVQREELIKNQTATLEDQIRQANEEARKREAENVKRITSERDQYKNGLADYAKRMRVEAMVESSGIDPDYKEEAINAAMSAIHAEIRDGNPVLTVTDGKGGIARDAETGDPMTPERWLQTYRQKKAKLFKGETGDNSGSGMNAGRGGGAGSLMDKDPLTWSFQEKEEYRRMQGPRFTENYNKLLQSWANKREKK